MRRTDNGAAPPGDHPYRPPQDGLLPDLPLYERPIGDGIAAADGRGTSVDHVTARRLAIWLAARPQAPVFTGAWSTSPRPERSAQRSRLNCVSTPAPALLPDQLQAARLMLFPAAQDEGVGSRLRH